MSSPEYTALPEQPSNFGFSVSSNFKVHTAEPDVNLTVPLILEPSGACASGLISTVIEYAAYEILYYGFNLVLWSYEPWPLNYKGKISVISSCLFGFMTALFMKLAVPPVEKLFDSKAKNYAAAAVFLFYIFCIGWEIYHFGR